MAGEIMYKINTESIGDVKKYIYHYRKGDREYGPYTYEDILELIKKGEIGPDDYIFKFGNKKFIKASEMDGLFDWSKKEEKNKEKPEEKPAEDEAKVNAETLKKEHKEENKSDFHIAFDKMPAHVAARRRKKPLGPRIAILAAGIVAVCLVIWVVLRMLV